MTTRSASYNTIYKTVSDSKEHSLLYQSSNTCFDLILKTLDINIEYLNENLISQYYDAYLSSNILDHINYRNNIIYEHNIPDVLCFHKTIPEKFKKEDLYIFKQNSGRSHKLFFGDTIQNSWSIKDKLTYVINYGVPECDIPEVSNKKTLVFFNTQKNSNLDNLYEYIKNLFPDTLMIKDISKYTYTELISVLSQYKLCLEHDTPINCIVSAYAGCSVLTSLPEIQNVNGYFNIKDYSSIANIISSHGNRPESLNDKNQIASYYSFSKFTDNFYKYLTNLKRTSVIP